MKVHPLHHLLARLVPYFPRSLVRRVAGRYIAGESLEEAITEAGCLNRKGLSATLDVLGEDCLEAASADAILLEYQDVLRAVHTLGVGTGLSIKLTAFGLRQDEPACRKRVAALAADCATHETLLRIDMENSLCTDETLAIYETVRCTGRVGIVLQSCLRRSEQDLHGILTRADAAPANVRLCKGIYREPSEIAYQEADEIRAAYLRLLDQMLEHGGFPALATHDPVLVEGALERIRAHGLKPDAYEFQMLLGVAEHLRDTLVANGHRVRVYVPFGRDWYAYSTRRLRENPQIAGYVTRQLFGGR